MQKTAPSCNELCFMYIKHTHASHKDIEMQPCNPMFQCSIRFHITLPPPYAEIHKAQPFQLLRTWVPLSPLFSFPHFLCRPCTFPVSVFFLTSSLFSHFFCLSCFLPFVLRVVDLGASR